MFPTLVRKAMAHLNKLQGTSPGARAALQERLEQITVHLGSFPKTLALKDQGLFSLGYFHQQAHDRAKPRERREAKEVAKLGLHSKTRKNLSEEAVMSDVLNDATRRHDFVLLFDVQDGNSTVIPMPATCRVLIPKP